MGWLLLLAGLLPVWITEEDIQREPSKPFTFYSECYVVCFEGYDPNTCLSWSYRECKFYRNGQPSVEETTNQQEL
jgi:hypothetical protein